MFLLLNYSLNNDLNTFFETSFGYILNDVFQKKLKSMISIFFYPYKF